MIWMRRGSSLEKGTAQKLSALVGARLHEALSPMLVPSILLLVLHGSALATVNQPPVACFLPPNPQEGTVATSFAVNASCSTDDRTPASKLQVRWDWEDDGTWDTTYSETKTATHQYPNEGTKTIRLEVRDQQGLSSTIARIVTVQPTLAQVLVGAPPEAPGATEPYIDVDPNNSARVVVAAITAIFDQGSSVPYPAFYSTDGGASFTRSVGAPFSHSGDPSLRFDTAGRVFLSVMDAYPASTDGTPRGVKVARSTDGGASFPTHSYAMDTATSFVFPDGSSHVICDQPDTLFDSPRLAVDKGPTSPYRDQLYVADAAHYFDLDGDGTCDIPTVGFVRSIDGGATWTSGRAFPALEQQSLAMGIAADGAIFFGSQNFGTPPCNSPGGVSVRRSTDGGATILPATCAFQSDGSIIPWGVAVVGHPWDPNRAYIVFEATVPTLGNSFHIYVLWTADGGASWGGPVRVDDVLPDDVVDHRLPSLSVASDGRLDVAWFDYRNSSPKRWVQNFQPGDVYYASSQGGSTWSKNLRLSQSTAPLFYGGGNDYLTVANAGTKALVVYAQDQDGNGPYETRLTTITFH